MASRTVTGSAPLILVVRHQEKYLTPCFGLRLPMFSQLLWFLLWPISALFYSADEMGIEETHIKPLWVTVAIASVILLFVVIYIHAKGSVS